MTDREILELAAKAAGMNVNRRCQNGRDADGHGNAGLWISGESTCWNPLTDDADALRLAVKLGISFWHEGGTEADNWERWTVTQGRRFDVESIEPHGDKYAATRRAIVRAAAAIGKAMP